MAAASAGDSVGEGMDDDDPEEKRLLAAHSALVAEGAIEPLARDDAETRRWLDCELASLVENRFFEPLDPASMTPAIRARWEPLATSDEPLSSPHGHDFYRLAYWIRDGGERRGTIALSTTFIGAQLCTVSSLYVLPPHRGTGVAARALARAREAVVAQGGLGLRVPAYWAWQPAVRFYLGLGLWVSNWKHALVFASYKTLPPYAIEITGDDATFGVVRDGRVEPMIAAKREGDRLRWLDVAMARASDAEARSLRMLAKQTFAVALAVRGFPLIRSEDAWNKRHRSADGGDPEGLAYKIELFEAWDRKSGFVVRAPRVPGLRYRDWDDID